MMIFLFVVALHVLKIMNGAYAQNPVSNCYDDGLVCRREDTADGLA